MDINEPVFLFKCKATLTMKTNILILFTILSTLCHGQVDSTDYYEKVIGFIPKSKTADTEFHVNPNGKILESIAKPKHGWIQIVILKQEGDWIQIKEASVSPGIKKLDSLKNSWIEISNIWFNLSNNSSRCYFNPDLNSEYFTVDLNTVQLLEIKDNWAKAKFQNNDKEVEGWFRKEDQCGFPWTACNYKK